MTPGVPLVIYWLCVPAPEFFPRTEVVQIRRFFFSIEQVLTENQKQSKRKKVSFIGDDVKIYFLLAQNYQVKSLLMNTIRHT